MIVFGGSSSLKLAECVCKGLDADLGLVDYRRFPDGEHYIRILSDVENRDCVLIQTTDTNDSLVELLLMLDVFRDLKVRSIHTIIPYIGYSRQDKRFRVGESFSLKTILGLIDQFSDSITTVNCHFLNSAGKFQFENIWVRNLDAFPLVAEYFKDMLDNPLIISPDKGALEYAKKAAKIVGCEFDYLQKIRVSDHKVEIDLKKIGVEGMDVVLLDDMISTGGTVIEAAEVIRSQNARSVNAGCIHGVFSKGWDIFDGILDELVCTDTISLDISKISVSKLIIDTVSVIV